ncbi:6,7-dimethyl-8-ribityllumazine synthase [Methanonatronarchaeum sp. AMET-Sl]|uniref:6,7-dimethyl-8-ribityllumazine synthase n=1 Tax=Methanonatronarchaeum sp. AMET-Sl TaxID=3037654 RepID=UPI00244DB55C|nr:6,7-dimethyl-8-ribityllumazine synthase [Methanonatronarchaeum sp. AMET-Sl]WGI17352.1 6,7-dimethyl-8-ribityllumazine synthase [Methanonatronarchaeum sp. AMET-Sl]
MSVKLGFVISEFNYDVTESMRELAERHADFLGAEVVEEVFVPGVFDMPLAIKNLLETDKIDAVVTLGCVIEGQTDHDQVVASQTSRKITDLSLDYDKPVSLGISGPGQTRHEAQQRVDYAKRAVESAVKMAEKDL